MHQFYLFDDGSILFFCGHIYIKHLNKIFSYFFI